MKRRLLRLLQRLGLIGPAFRAYERAVALRPQTVTPADGLPLPPRRLMVRVAGTADADWFLRSGRAGYERNRYELEARRAAAGSADGVGLHS